jgi:hypothetical protein
MFLRDRQATTTRRFSKTSTGSQGQGNSTAGALSADGTWAAFITGGQLVSADVNHRADVYLRGPEC